MLNFQSEYQLAFRTAHFQFSIFNSQFVFRVNKLGLVVRFEKEFRTSDFEPRFSDANLLHLFRAIRPTYKFV